MMAKGRGDRDGLEMCHKGRTGTFVGRMKEGRLVEDRALEGAGTDLGNRSNLNLPPAREGEKVSSGF